MRDMKNKSEVVTADSKIDFGNSVLPRHAIPPKPLDSFSPASDNYRVEKNTFKKTLSVVNRVFYIDVASLHPNDIPNYMEKVKETLTSPKDEKYSAVDHAKSIGAWEDFFIPVRGMLHSTPSLWQRIKWFFVGRPAQQLCATRIELHTVEITV